MKYIISLGGSIIKPDKIDYRFLKNFRRVILSRVARGDKFLIITGGGAVTREYQAAAKKIANASDINLDWLGIIACRLNAHLLHSIFGKSSHPQVFGLDVPPRTLTFGVTIASGGIKPGGSSDTTSMEFAKNLGVKTILNLTNVAGIYTEDPGKSKTARIIPKLSWNEFRRQFGSSRKPGQHFPFDPTAYRLGKSKKMTIVIINGRNLKNLVRVFRDESFVGTTIK